MKLIVYLTTILISTALLTPLSKADESGIIFPSETDSSAPFEQSVPKDYISDFPNELIPGQSLALIFSYNDIVIPGNNGMDIIVTRKYQKGAFPRLVGFGLKGWYLDAPLIHTYKHHSSGPIAVNLDCMPDIQSISIGINGVGLRSVGYSSQNKMPSNTISALSDGSILVCDGGFPTLIQQDGRKLVFGAVLDESAGSTTSTSYYLSKIKDRFGNFISYFYNPENSDVIKRKKLVGIKRSDGYYIQFNYEKVGYYERIKSISYKGKVVNYSYTPSLRLEKFTDQEGRDTIYKYYTYLNYLKSVETPEGLHVEYDYYPLNADSINNGSLRTKTITGPGIKKRIFHHEFPSFFQGHRAIQIEFDVIPGKERTKEFVIKKVPAIADNYLSGTLVTSGRIISKSIFLGTSQPRYTQAYVRDKLLVSVNTEWGQKIFGTVGCAYRIGTIRDDRRVCALPLVLSKTIKINNAGVFDEFTTKYTQHNEFGRASHVYQYNNFDNKKRYTLNSFTNDYSSWVVNRIKSVKQSDNNITWKNFKDITYYPETQSGGYRSQIKSIKKFGVIKNTNTHYHSTGEVKTALDANNNASNFNNYYLGLPKLIQIPGINQAKNLAINDDGTVKSVIDYLGNQTSFNYDNIGRILNIVHPKMNGIKSWHDSYYSYLKVDSNDLSIASANLVSGQNKQVYTQGNLQRVEYLDALSRVILLKEVDLSNLDSARFTRFKYDINNMMTFKSYPSKYPNSTQGFMFTYDELNRVRTITTNSGTSYINYLNGNRKQVTNTRGYTTIYTYQAFGDSNTSKVTKIESPEGITTDISRDVFGKIIKVKQSGYYQGSFINASRTYYFDTRQFLCRKHDPELGYTSYRYDDSGKLKWKLVGSSANYCNYNGLAPSNAIKFIYDSRGNTLKIDYPSGTNDLTFTYDSNDNMKTAIRGGVKWEYSYNNLNKLTREKLLIDGRAFTIQYGYDGSSYHSSTTYPTGRQIDYLPNAFGEHTQANNYVNSTKYHPSGKMNSFKYGNGKSFIQTLNDEMFPDKLYVKSISDLNYGYDSEGNVSSITDGIISSENRTMAYDGVDRLTSANGPWGKSSFRYDPLGNIMTKTLGQKSYNFSYNRSKNTLTSVFGDKGYSFEYDAHGNIKGNGHHTFFYDNANLLMNVNAGSVAKYRYDAQKKRVQVIEGSQKTYNVYSNSGKLLHKFNVNSNQPSDYIYLNDLQVVKIDGIPGPQAPLSPAYLSISGYNSGGSYTVNWSSSEGASSYTLQEKKGTGRWSTIYSGSSINKNLTGRIAESYQYRVRACGSAGCSQYRESAILGVFEPTIEQEQIPTTPDTPTSPSSDNDGTFYVNWKAVTGATSYQIQHKFETKPWLTVQTSNKINYYASSLSNGTYSYRVRACNDVGCSSYSLSTTTVVDIFIVDPVLCPVGKICTILR